MFKTTFKGYVPKLKLKGAEATIVEGKAIESKGGSIRYTLRGEYEGHATLPKTVSKADFESVYGFDAKEAEAAIIYGEKEGKPVGYIHVVGHEDKRGVTPTEIHTGTSGISPEEMVEAINRKGAKAADTVGSPSPASVEPPAPSEKPFPQEPSNEHFSAFGFGKDDEEEEAEPEEPKTQEFTVVLQEGDKLELTDVEETADAKDEDEGADEENEEKASDCDDHFYEAVQAKVTRPVKEEEEPEEESDEEGMSTGVKVALGVGALAAGVALLGAEDGEGELDYWAGEDAFWRAEGSGEIEVSPYDEVREVPVHFRHDYASKDYTWKTDKEVLTDEETDEVIEMVEQIVTESDEDEGYETFDDLQGLRGHVDWGTWKDEGRFYGLAAEGKEAEDFQKMTSSEFVPFDQMQEELGQMQNETTAPLADAHNYDYEPSNEPSNANFSAEDKPTINHLLLAIERKVAKGDITAEEGEILKEIKDPTQRMRRYTQMRRKSDPTFRKDFSAEFEARTKRKSYYDPLTDTSHYDKKGKLLITPDGMHQTHNRHGGERKDRDKLKTHDLSKDLRRKGIPLKVKPSEKQEGKEFYGDTVGSPSPSGPSSVPEPAEATGSEPSNEHMEADSKNGKMAIGITAVGIGIALALGKDRLGKLFDRFNL